MRLTKLFSTATIAMLCSLSGVMAHPLAGLSGPEIEQTSKILKDQGTVKDDTLFPLIELVEPSKQEVLDWQKDHQKSPDRRAMVQFTTPEGFTEAIVNITKNSVESVTPIEGSAQHMILFSEFMQANEGALSDPGMIDGLKKRGLTPDQAFCLPLTAGNFMTDDYKGNRLMKVPCYKSPDGSNYYAKPIEGLFVVFDLKANKVLEVVDEEIVPVPEDNWGYTEKEIAERTPLRPEGGKAKLTFEGEPNYKVNGSEVQWDIWRFNYRIDKRPGLVLTNLEVDDQGTWRSVLYEAHLSEVFVPYQDPSAGWYWRTYMDSGEYGFGLFLTPLAKGIDCPEYATYLPAMIADDQGNPLEIPDAVCIFEQATGGPAWRHFEVFAQSPEAPVPAEGRPETILIVRTASEVGNYDYLIDYRLFTNGEMKVMIGATGLDAVKGVASKSMDDATAANDTQYGTLIAPNLVAANHDHYFNFRLDFDVDQPVNKFSTLDIVPAEVAADAPRRSLWSVKESVPATELDARYQLSAMKPRFFLLTDPDRKGYLGHSPAWKIHHGSIAYGPFDFKNDPPFQRNAYIEYSVWNTVYDPNQRYAGGKYAFQSDAKDGLAQWVQANKPLAGQDIVTWFTAGFHHIPRMEDWPVMQTEWKTVHITPHNFFAFNPAISLRK